MADPVVAPDPADPAKPGSQTSEFTLAKLMAWIGGAVAILLPVLVILSDALTKAQDAFPGAKWLGAIAGVVASLLAILLTFSKYIGGRTENKVAQINGAATIQAAKIAAGSFDATAAVPK